jgi:hypothetical protein
VPGAETPLILNPLKDPSTATKLLVDTPLVWPIRKVLLLFEGERFCRVQSSVIPPELLRKMCCAETVPCLLAVAPLISSSNWFLVTGPIACSPR